MELWKNTEVIYKGQPNIGNDLPPSGITYGRQVIFLQYRHTLPIWEITMAYNYDCHFDFYYDFTMIEYYDLPLQYHHYN